MRGAGRRGRAEGGSSYRYIRFWPPTTALLRLGADLAGREVVADAAELAGDLDLAVLDHVVAVVLREALEHGLDRFARARALRPDIARLEHAHARLVEQAIDQPLARQRRVDQLDILDRRDQRPPFRPG